MKTKNRFFHIQSLLTLPRTVYALSFGSFFNNVASEMIIPLIPIFLTTTLGTPMAIVGIILGLTEALAHVLKIFSGWLSDKLNTRKPLVIFGYGSSAIGKALIGFAYNWPMVLLSRIIDRTGKGIRTSAKDALLAEITEPNRRGMAFGFHRLFDSGGAVMGPLVALALLHFLTSDLRTVFLLTLIPSAISLFILIAFVKDKKNPDKQQPSTAISWVKENVPFNRFLMISAIFALGNSSEAFLIIRAQSLGFSIAFTILAHVLFNLTYTIFALPMGVLADYINPKKIIIAGYLVFVGVYFMAGWTTQAWWMWFILPLYGLFMAMTDSINKTYISHIVSPAVFGTAFGLHQTVIGIGTFFASTLAGILWSTVGKSAPFYIGSGIGLAAALLFAITIKKQGS